MKKILRTSAALFAMANIVNSALAQETSVPESKGSFNVNGYVDAFYQYNLNRPESGANQGRIFDLYHNNISLGLVQTVLTYSKDKVTAVADITVGPNADLANFGNGSSARLIKQAYIAYDFNDRLKLTVGQYGTHIGYELVDAPLNYNYSLSYLFGNGPFYHTGAKLDYSINERLGLMVGVVNGWDCLSDFNEQKSITTQLRLSPAEGMDMYINWIGGDEYKSLSAFGDTKGSYTSLFDLTTSYQLTDVFKVGVNAAYGSFYTGAVVEDATDRWSKDATWKGAALYFNYDLTDKFGLGFRGEYFSDPEGVRYSGPLEVTSYTVTGNVKMAKGNLLFKPEVRIDQAKDAFFEDNVGMFTKKNQTTVGAAFVYMFSLN
ncbi:porin [Rufibacter roseus]|uniref:Porin n=1 Tax=Rufibacter roseus TaxID=1567108 RepID=A0ABW2DIV5_9BACT|nr:porin [Rufibacter roseus]